MYASPCAFHYRYELYPDDAFRRCFECGHVFLTWHDLVMAEDALLRNMGDLNRPADRPITVCPLCHHDF
jgi:hypothetical protein